MPSVLVTGSSRGLGLEFVRQYAADGWRVFAGARRPEAAAELGAVALAAAGRVTLHAFDVAEHRTVDRLARELAGEPIDILLNAAGLAGHEPQAFGLVDYSDWLAVLQVNVMGPLKMAESFVDHVEASERRTIAILSSRMGSIHETPGGYYPYSSSKAAVNMVGRSLAADLDARDITVVMLNPGPVAAATDRGGLSATASVAQLRAVIERLTPADSGSFLNYDGSACPW